LLEKAGNGGGVDDGLLAGVRKGFQKRARDPPDPRGAECFGHEIDVIDLTGDELQGDVVKLFEDRRPQRRAAEPGVAREPPPPPARVFRDDNPVPGRAWEPKNLLIGAVVRLFLIEE